MYTTKSSVFLIRKYFQGCYLILTSSCWEVCFFFSEQLQLEDFVREGREITLLAPNEMVEKQKGKPSKKVKFLLFFSAKWFNLFCKLIHFRPMFYISLYYPRKCQKTFGFQSFSGVWKRSSGVKYVYPLNVSVALL